MKNYVKEGDTLTLAAPYNVVAGAGALVGSVFGVAACDLLSTVVGEFQIEGVFDLAKASGEITQGAKVYWDDSAKNVTTTAQSNTLIGVAEVLALTGDTTCRVYVDGAIR